eukprot:COSAG02_NODE_4201_length_5632_cov_5.111874_7_plen_132_part_00
MAHNVLLYVRRAGDACNVRGHARQLLLRGHRCRVASSMGAIWLLVISAFWAIVALSPPTLRPLATKHVPHVHGPLVAERSGRSLIKGLMPFITAAGRRLWGYSLGDSRNLRKPTHSVAIDTRRKVRSSNAV